MSVSVCVCERMSSHFRWVLRICTLAVWLDQRCDRQQSTLCNLGALLVGSCARHATFMLNVVAWRRRVQSMGEIRCYVNLHVLSEKVCLV